jgi:bacteriophage N4 adsorption protein B
MAALDAFVAACLVPLAIAAVVSGLDELVLDLVTAWRWLRGPRSHTPSAAGLPSRDPPEKRIAIFLPLWKEEAVVGSMLAHNIGAIRYSEYHFFVGVYPNDLRTMDAVREAEVRFPNVHLSIVPHNGPTSKADCLNWILQSMLAHEEACGVRFDIVVTHDAEDVIHPSSLLWINHYAADFDMVQVPVLPLCTPLRDFTHGVYCDEFAEFQTKDVPARRVLGGFLPSNGVGTGYTRKALDRMAASAHNQVFDPTCLTEDYDCGFRLHQMGFRQVFVPIRFEHGEPMATREFFPRHFRQAVRQRTRWVTGICLQGWERHGWRGGAAVVYWFWRDRKGLIGNPLSLFGNLVCLYGLLTWIVSSAAGQPWGMQAVALGPATRPLLAAALASQILRTAVRAGCSARFYGWAFAAGVPLRTAWANWMNAIATITAVFTYFRKRLLRQPQVWLKTAHTYPSLALPAAFAEAIIDADQVRREAARALPLYFVRRWKVLPFKVAEGSLFLATPVPPSENLGEDLKRFTRLAVRYQLVSKQNYETLLRELLK